MGKYEVMKVAAQVGKGIAAHATGHPAKVFVVGAATAVAIMGTAVGYGAYCGAMYLIENVKDSYERNRD